MNIKFEVKGQLNVKTALNLILKENWSSDLVALFDHHLIANVEFLFQLLMNTCSGQLKENESLMLLKFLSLLNLNHHLFSSLPQKIIEVFLECESSLVKIALLEFAQFSLPKTSLNVICI